MIEHLIENPWWWFGFAVLLGIGEIITPGVFLIWVAAAAAITGVVAMLAPIPPTVQFVIFALLCWAAVWFGRRWYADNPVESQDPLLNDRVARLIGERATLTEAISNSHGRVRIGDSVWECSGPDLAAGTSVKVVGAQGAVLQVEPVT